MPGSSLSSKVLEKRNPCVGFWKIWKLKCNFTKLLAPYYLVYARSRRVSNDDSYEIERNMKHFSNEFFNACAGIYQVFILLTLYSRPDCLRVKETKGRNDGQTPFTIITKTASPKKKLRQVQSWMNEWLIFDWNFLFSN